MTGTGHHGAQMKEPETQHIRGVGSRALLGATVASAVLSGFGLLAVGTLPGVCNALKLSHFTAVKLSHPGQILSSVLF